MISPLAGACGSPDLEATVARRYRAVLLLCGTVLFASLILTIGPATVLASFRELSWRLLLVIVFPCVVLKTFDTLAWRFAFPHGRVPFLPLASALLAGHAVASTTPTSMVGGNAAMAWTLRDRVSLPESLSSLIIVQTTSTASQGLFLLLGILIARATLPPSTALVRIMEWLLVLELIGVAGFVVVQMRGIMARGYGLLGRLGFSGSSDLGKGATDVDEALAAFYRTQPGRLALSLLCNLLGWITRAAEVWLILYLLHASVSVAMALTIEAFGTGIGFATFFLPLDLGVEEGATVATFLAVGLSGGTGLSLALVRRIREAAWVALGLLLLVGKPKPSPVALDAKAA
jgi:glycosyltransferase 2 family protein